MKHVRISYDHRDKFDEMVTKSVAGVHVEMMSDKELWMRIDEHRTGEGIVLVATVEKGKLNVVVRED